jgi:hypothetical protein
MYAITMAHMPEKPTRKFGVSKKERAVPAVSAVLDTGELVELVYDRHAGRTAFAVWQESEWELRDRVDDKGRTLVPYSADNNLMRHNVVLFPTGPQDYGSTSELVAEVTAFIHRYVDVSDSFERLASYYVLFTWLYEGFNELPYLRLKGNYGTGKTRFLQTVGSICYRPIFANGASTVSPIFHMLDMFGGTLIVDEADFRYSDEKADMVKIFNNGNVRGMPVLRSQITRDREFDPRVFQVFGPKIVATRGGYDDAALESRFITEQTGGRDLRDDIPINLPSECEEEALALRNKLLMYRFRNWRKYKPTNELIDRSIEPRLNQILAPLLSIVEDRKSRLELQRIASQYHGKTSTLRDHRNGEDSRRKLCK